MTNISDVQLVTHAEPVEVTRGPTPDYPGDIWRKFIPGPATYTLRWRRDFDRGHATYETQLTEDEARRFVEMSSSERVDFVAWLNFDRIRATNLLRE